jgi:ankyrin repeat protein
MMSGTARDTALHFTCFSEANSPVYDACTEGDVDALSDLLDTSDVNLQDGNGYTALHVTCTYGHVEATRLLLSWFARTE